MPEECKQCDWEDFVGTFSVGERCKNCGAKRKKPGEE